LRLANIVYFVTRHKVSQCTKSVQYHKDRVIALLGPCETKYDNPRLLTVERGV